MNPRLFSGLIIVLAPLTCSCAQGEDLEEEAFIKITNQKYDNNCFWGGPKGLDYGLLHDAQGIQKPALYPDQASTYFVAQFKLTEGASLTITGEYPHERYFSFTAANNLGDGGLGGGNFLLDEDIQPDEGSTNPFSPGSNRYATPRNYTVRIVNGTNEHERNTLYTGTEPDTYVYLAMRNYVADRGFDGTGVATLNQLNVDGELLTTRPAAELQSQTRPKCARPWVRIRMLNPGAIQPHNGASS